MDINDLVQKEIGKTSQINTFLKGMNTDTSDSLIDSSQYRFAENLRINTDTDSNTGELHLIEGNILKDYLKGIDIKSILGITSIRDFGLAVIRDSHDYWSIYKFTDDGEPICLFGPCSEKIWNDDTDKISVLVRYESENNVKLYIADGIHEILSMIIPNEPVEEPKTDIQYLSGHDSVTLPPVSIQVSDVAGQLYPARVQYAYRIYSKYGAATSLSMISAPLSLYKTANDGYSSTQRTGRSVKITIPEAYYSALNISKYTDVSITPHCHIDRYNVDGDYKIHINEISVVVHPKPTWSIQQTSNVFYLEDATQENQTPLENITYENLVDETFTLDGRHYPERSSEDDSCKLSEGSRLIFAAVWFNESGTRSSRIFLLSYSDAYNLLLDEGVITQKEDLYDYDVDPEKRIIPEEELYQTHSPEEEHDGEKEGEKSISDIFNRILIFRISYRENGQTPEIALIKDLKYTPGDIIIDRGDTDINTVAISDFLSYVRLGIIPKLIESKNDYLFAANVKYKRSETDATFEDVDVTTTTKEGDYDVEGEGEYFAWQIISGDSYTISQDNQDDDVKSLHTAFRPGETYRFGVILYDLNGNASSVKHIQDIEIPYYDCPVFADMIHINNSSAWQTNYNPTYEISPPTIQFKLKKPIPNCSRYEIVRCVRTLSDKATISLGLLGKALRLYHVYGGNYGNLVEDPTNITCPSGFMTLDQMLVRGRPEDYTTSESIWPGYDRYGANDIHNRRCQSCNDLLMFSSPEYVYQPDDIKDILTQHLDNVYIKCVTEYETYCDEEQADQIYGYDSIKPYFTGIIGGEYPEYRTRFMYDGDPLGGYEIHFNQFCADYCRDRSGTRLKPFDRNDHRGYISFNYVQPYQKYQYTSVKDGIRQDFLNGLPDEKITNFGYPKVPLFNDLASNDALRFKDDVTQVGSYSYIGWSSACVSDLPTGSGSDLAHLWRDLGDTSEDWPTEFSGIGTTGSCILMKLESSLGGFYTHSKYNIATITVADIRKPVVPYGGSDEQAIKNSVYYSFGENFPNNTESHVLNCGDCYIRMFQYNALHNFFDATYVRMTKMGTVYSVPIVMDIDLHGQFGKPFGVANNSYYIQDTVAQFDGYTQDRDAYLYNTAYNSHPDVISYFANTDDEFSAEKYDTRVHYSLQKTNGEDYDNWLQFKTMNFLDVDTRYGEITNIRLFKDRLFFWQNFATGILAVNERVLLKDASDTEVSLGTGSVLERYDYISTIYGMKPDQLCDAKSNDALYWWDGYNKEILLYREKYSATPLSTTKHIKNYLNENKENYLPHLVYDNKYKEVICGCVNDESVVYNEQIEAFSSIYSFVPKHDFILKDSLYTTDDTSIYKQNECEDDKAELFNKPAFPYLKYVVNNKNVYSKTFDVQEFGGRFYGGSEIDKDDRQSYQDLNFKGHKNTPFKDITFTYSTPLKQKSSITGDKAVGITEYDFRLTIPRSGQQTEFDPSKEYGNRLRGKTMQCELLSSNNSIDFSLQYITTKYRMSWS